jgi:hypothetical protein
VELNREAQEKAEAVTQADPAISLRATSIAPGLIRTERAAGIIKAHRGMLRLECHSSDDYYWIALDGSRLLRGKWLSEATELQPKSADAMERAGR